jgi:hypothetical protein
MTLVRGRASWFLIGFCLLVLIGLAIPRHQEARALFGGKDALYWSGLLSGTPTQRTNATNALKTMGPAAARDLVAILPAKVKWKDRALGMIEKLLPGRLAWRLLRPTGYYDVPRKYSIAAEGLEFLGADARVVVPEIVAAIPTAAPNVYGPLIHALTQINPEGMVALGKVLRMGDISRAAFVASQIGTCGSNAFLVLPDLLWVATNGQPGHESATLAIGAVGEKAFPAIRALLHDKDKNIVVIGINSVGAMGAVGEPFLPELNALAEKGNVDVRAKAILALGRVNPNEPKSLAVLKECTRDLDSAIRLSAVSALQNAPFQVWRDDALFESLLNDPAPEVRERVRTALGEKNPLKGH